MKSNDLLNELLRNQLKTVPHDKKFSYADLKRISKHIKNSIFDENLCCLWEGYVTNENNASKGIYINFYFKGKKIALHRLLYMNFVGDLTDNEYLKFNCEHKGKCCNIKHLKKFAYIKKNELVKPKGDAVQNNAQPKTLIRNMSFSLSFD